MRDSHPGTLPSSGLLHAVASEAQGAQLVSSYYILKEWEKICLFVSASNERQLSRDTSTILFYTNVTGPNQSGLSGDRPSQTHNTMYAYLQGNSLCVQYVRSILSPWHS